MKNIIPKTAAVHGITGFGRSSVSVVFPVLSSMGIQVCPLPTAVLSSHPGGFENYSFYEMTKEMANSIKCWKAEDIRFDCIYSGFLGSAKQADLVIELIDNNRNALVIIDPVMGDNGKLYKITQQTMKDKMLTLIKKADVITPNYTEACFLTGFDYNTKPIERDKIEELLRKLSDLGPKNVVITGVKIDEDKHGNFAYCRSNDSYWKIDYKHIPIQYPGTGDIFASVLAGYLIKDCDLPEAVKKATDFVSLAVKKTYESKTPSREGVLLESILPQLNNLNNLNRGETINE